MSDVRSHANTVRHSPEFGVSQPCVEQPKHVDLAAFDDDGKSLEIWPCAFCDLWHIEVVRDSSAIFVREWHAATCEHYLAIVAELVES